MNFLFEITRTLCDTIKDIVIMLIGAGFGVAFLAMLFLIGAVVVTEILDRKCGNR